MGAADETSGLIAQIRAAFQDVLRGEGVSLSETQVLDDYGSMEARQEARSWDTDTHWREVSDEDLLHGNYLTYLDDLGWRYYLPAFMTHSLKILRSPRTGIADTRAFCRRVLAAMMTGSGKTRNAKSKKRKKGRGSIGDSFAKAS